MEALLARAFQILIALIGAYSVALWFALIVWTFQDIQQRSRSVIAQIFSTLVVVLFFIPGVLIYMILRPKETLDDAFQRSLEEEYLLQDLEELPLCPNCQHYVEEEFVFCPVCRTELRQDCHSCGRLVDVRWEICPYCGEEQYVEEEPAYLGEDWTIREQEGVGRMLSQARDRIAPRRNREALTEPAPSQTTLPIVPSVAEQVRHRERDDDALPETTSWLPSEDIATGRANGNVPRSHTTRWADLDEDAGDAEDRMDRTDEIEIPAEIYRPPR